MQHNPHVRPYECLPDVGDAEHNQPHRAPIAVDAVEQHAERLGHAVLSGPWWPSRGERRLSLLFVARLEDGEPPLRLLV